MKLEKTSSKKLVKYQIFFEDIEEIQLELFNLFLIEKKIGSLEESNSNYYLYLPAKNHVKILKEIKSYLEKNNVKAEIKFVNFLDDSYLYNWEKYFTPELIDNLLIKPAFLQLDIIEIEVGQAFGTGKHPTTKICIEFIIELIKGENIKTFLDAGTGSGIISIVACKKKIKHIYAFDIDYEAIKIAKKNFIKNNCKNVISFCSSFEALKKNIKFDLICVNILSNIILKYKELIKNIVNKNKYLIISGIEISEKEDFLIEFDYLDKFQLLKETKKDNWYGFLFKKF